MMEVLINLLVFAFITFLLFGLGWFVLKKYRNHFSKIEMVVVATICGLSIWTVLIYIASFVGLRSIVSVFVIATSIMGLIDALRGKLLFKRIKIDYLLSAVVIMGALGQLFLVAPSGLVYEDGMRIYGVNAHDGMWHVSLMQILKNDFPPKMPTYAGEQLTGYHFFVDLFGSEMSRIFSLSPLWLTFRLLPMLFSIFTSLGIYALVMRLTKSRLSAFLGIFLINFAGSFAYFIPLFFKDASWSETSFWAHQSITTFINLPLGA